jgi:hypothetical protein
MSHCYLNLWLPTLIFQHSLLLNLWPYTTEMWQPVYLHCITLQVSFATTSLLWKWLPHHLQTSYCRLHLSKDWKIGSQKKPDMGCKVDEAGQSTEALWWPLEYADVYGLVLSWWRSTFVTSLWRWTLRKHFFSFHIDVQVDRLASGLSARCIVAASQLLMGGPSTGDQTHCPVLVLTMPITLPNRWRCFYPLACLYRRLLSACEYLWLIRFLPK